MTVKELIELLQTFPPHAVVIHPDRSDPRCIDPEDISSRYSSWSGSKEVKFVLRDGRVHAYAASEWPADWVPQFIDVVVFPGN